MADYAALAAELKSVDLVALSDAAAAEKLNTDTVTTQSRVLVPAAQILQFARDRGLMARIDRAAGTYGRLDSEPGTNEATSLAAMTFVDLFFTPEFQVDLDSSRFRATLAVLKAHTPSLLESRDYQGNVLVSADSNETALLALADRTITTSRAVAVFGRPVTVSSVIQARRL